MEVLTMSRQHSRPIYTIHVLRKECAKIFDANKDTTVYIIRVTVVGQNILYILRNSCNILEIRSDPEEQSWVMRKGSATPTLWDTPSHSPNE